SLCAVIGSVGSKASRSGNPLTRSTCAIEPSTPSRKEARRASKSPPCDFRSNNRSIARAKRARSASGVYCSRSRSSNRGTRAPLFASEFICKTESSARQRHFASCAAERSLIYGHRTAVQARELAHDRQTDTLTAHALVEPRSPRKNMGALLRRYARPVVLDDELQSIAPCLGSSQSFRAYVHFGASPLERIIEQIACHLGQIFPIAEEDTSPIDFERALDAAVGVNLEQRGAQRLQILAYV